MIQQDLISRLGREVGLQPSNEQQFSALEDLLNDAGYELYTQTDLPRSLREESFSLDTTDPLVRVTLPSRVGEIRAVRRGWMPVTLHDMRPKYHTNPWPKDNMYTFRQLGERPICRSIDNAVGLYMTPLVNFQGDLEVSIVGSTADADEVHASFDSTGAGSAVGVLWEDIYAINKNLPTPSDIILLSGDATGAEMARIPNYSDTSLYIELELRETVGGCSDCCGSQPAGSCACIEVLYKPPFRPMLEPTSVFQVSGYDAPLIYKAVEIYRLRGIGSSSTEDQINAAVAHAKRADDVLKNTIQSRIQGQQLVINFGRARADIGNLRGLRSRRYGSTYGPYSWSPLR